MNDLLYQIGLTQIAGIGPVTARHLLAHFGNAKAVFEARKKELQVVPGIGPHTAKIIMHQEVLELAEQELSFIEKHQIQTFFYQDESYPKNLKRYPDAPIVLYFRGNTDLNHQRNIAIVGTRKPSPQGLKRCEELVEELQEYKVQVISGLAYGIDVCAHKKCLDLNIPTIGALGHGLGLIYPAQHQSIAKKMCVKGGLLTEHISQAKPEREHFPMRNRIVAGLCDALIVVETARKGGSMITACLANDYHKDVFAFPGRVKDQQSQGCNLLIKSHRAALIESAQDVAYVLGWEKTTNRIPKQRQLFIELTDDEKLIVDLLSKNETINIDRLSFATQLKGSALATSLLNLEFKGMIKTLPGKRYTLI